MKRFMKTGDYARNRLTMAMAAETHDNWDSMAQIKKEIKGIIRRHMDIKDDAYEIKIILKDHIKAR